MTKYTLKHSSETPSPMADCIDLLSVLVQAAVHCYRYSIEGKTGVRGRRPTWLAPAGDLVLVSWGPGEVVFGARTDEADKGVKFFIDVLEARASSEMIAATEDLAEGYRDLVLDLFGSPAIIPNVEV